MPEALFVLLVFAVCIVVYIAAWLQSRDPSKRNPTEDLHRLRHHEAWLQDRLALARREQWGHEMIEAIDAELRATAQQLARTTSAS